MTDYKQKYIECKTKYLDLKQNKSNYKDNKFIILFPDINGNITVYDQLLSQLNINTTNIIKIKYIFTNSTYNLDDLLFENIAKHVTTLLNKNHKYIVIGIEQGCHLANYFSNKYPKYVKYQMLLANRRINKENYEKTIANGYRNLEYNYNKTYADKYKYGITDNNDLHEKIKENSPLVYGTVMLQIRSQYNKIPIKQKVQTYIFDRLTLDLDIMEQHNLKDTETKYTKQIYNMEQAMLSHCKDNIDKYMQNQNIIKNSPAGMVHIDYSVVDIRIPFLENKDVMDKVINVLKK